MLYLQGAAAVQVQPDLTGYTVITKKIKAAKGTTRLAKFTLTPSKLEIPFSERGTGDVPTYTGASDAGKREIEYYFRVNSHFN